MSKFAIQGIDHVNVTTPEELEDAVLRFYSECLGLEAIPKPEETREGGGWFRAGSQEVHVSRDPHNPPQSAHFGIVVDDFDAVVEKLREAGIHIEQAPAIPGRHRLYTRDPAGNRIEVTAMVEPPAAVRVEEV